MPHNQVMDHMALSQADRVMDKEMAERRVTVAIHNQPLHKTLIASLSNRPMIIMDRNHLGMAASRHLMGSKVPMVLRDKEVERVTDSKAPTVVKAKQVKLVARARGLDETMAIVKKEGATEAGAVAVAATIVAVMTAVVDTTAADTTAAEEADLLVWEVVTVVATKITVALETTAQGMNQLETLETTLTTTPFL